MIQLHQGQKIRGARLGRRSHDSRSKSHIDAEYVVLMYVVLLCRKFANGIKLWIYVTGKGDFQLHGNGTCSQERSKYMRHELKRHESTRHEIKRYETTRHEVFETQREQQNHGTKTQSNETQSHEIQSHGT